MKPEEFAKNVEFLIDPMISWAACVRNPFGMCRSILAEAKDDLDAVKRAVRLWITAFIVNVVFQGWVYQLYGISLSNFSFYLSSGFFLLAMLLWSVISLHLGFRLFKLSISFIDTFVTYTVFIGAFAPIVGILSSPSLALSLGRLKILKSQNLDFASAIRSHFSLADLQQDSFVQVLSSIAFILLTAFYFWQGAMILEVLSNKRSAERARIFDAGSFSILIALVPGALLGLVYSLMIYSFL